jgi:hypothetical protein
MKGVMFHAWDGWKVQIELQLENLKETDNLGDTGVDGTTILKLMLNKQNVSM